MVLLILNYLDPATVTKTADSLEQLSQRVSRSGIVMRSPSDADQRSEVMPITIPTGSRSVFGGPRNEDRHRSGSANSLDNIFRHAGNDA